MLKVQSEGSEMIITLNCKDGELELDEDIYNESCLVRDLVAHTQHWIAEHTKDEVRSEIEELYYKWNREIIMMKKLFYVKKV